MWNRHREVRPISPAPIIVRISSVFSNLANGTDDATFVTLGDDRFERYDDIDEFGENTRLYGIPLFIRARSSDRNDFIYLLYSSIERHSINRLTDSTRITRSRSYSVSSAVCTTLCFFFLFYTTRKIKRYKRKSFLAFRAGFYN